MQATRLSERALDRLKPLVRGLNYRRDTLGCGIVHIGIGAFHRAHMAHYVDQLMATHPDWAIIGASLRRPDTKEALEPQDYLYSLNIQGDAERQTSVIGSIIDIIDASTGSQPLIAQLAMPSTRIVSLTVTEKGYCHEPATGQLQLTHPDIMHDLANRRTPRSVPGILVAALAERRARGLEGFTVLSCDNLQGNGKIIRQAILDFAQLHDPSLAQWISAHASFPSTMVDRIVPATSDDDRAMADDALGLADAWPVMTEPFSQWVVEDHFIAGRPPFETAGVEMVDDVEPFELMKLRMLNGSHSAIAYLGVLLGKTFVAEVVAVPQIADHLRALMRDEVAPTLTLGRNEMAIYGEKLLHRFSNSQLRHRCAQIAMDGSQKLPQRVLVPIRERLAQGQDVTRMALTLAAWIAYLERHALDAQLTLVDPMADALIEAVRASGNDSAAMVRAVMSIKAFSGAVPLAEDFILVVSDHLQRIRRDGPLLAVAAATGGHTQSAP